MSDPYHEWLDRELVKDHEADPEPFRQPLNYPPMKPTPKLTDDELIERIEYLRNADHLGSWGKIKLSESLAEATKRKIKIDR